jgi:hypothetical protein
MIRPSEVREYSPSWQEQVMAVLTQAQEKYEFGGDEDSESTLQPAALEDFDIEDVKRQIRALIPESDTETYDRVATILDEAKRTAETEDEEDEGGLTPGKYHFADIKEEISRELGI